MCSDSCIDVSIPIHYASTIFITNWQNVSDVELLIFSLLIDLRQWLAVVAHKTEPFDLVLEQTFIVLGLYFFRQVHPLILF